jgi:hypothetical protein
MRIVLPVGAVTPGIGVQVVGFVISRGGVIDELVVEGRQTCQ